MAYIKWIVSVNAVLIFSPVRRHFIGLGMSGAVVIAAYNSYCFGITDFRWLQALQDVVSIPGTVHVSTGRCWWKTMWTLTWGYHSCGTHLGPVVQSVVSLTSSLRVISLTVLAESIHKILIFFAEKMWVAFALQKLLTFFQQKISAYLCITRCKF